MPPPEPHYEKPSPFDEQEYNAGDVAYETACEVETMGPATDLGKQETGTFAGAQSQEEFLQEQAEKLDELFKGKFTVGEPEEGDKPSEPTIPIL